MSVAVVHGVADLRAVVAGWRAAGLRVALVPTMGALHAGHTALVEAAGYSADRTIATIFVNPRQFAPGEDFGAYPRDLDADLRKLDAAGTDLVYAPTSAAMYPDGFCTTVSSAGPSLAGLEDSVRPSHFAGVTTVVAKLLLQVLPDVALFGEKDFQQLRVIERMVCDLDMPVAIHGVRTVREADGLAMSSRNGYLDAAERKAAPALQRALSACAVAIGEGALLGESLAAARTEIEAAGFRIDYLEARDAGTLAPVEQGFVGPARLLAAARLGRTRLIDNVEIAPRPGLRAE